MNSRATNLAIEEHSVKNWTRQEIVQLLLGHWCLRGAVLSVRLFAEKDSSLVTPVLQVFCAIFGCKPLHRWAAYIDWGLCMC